MENTSIRNNECYRNFEMCAAVYSAAVYSAAVIFVIFGSFCV